MFNHSASLAMSTSALKALPGKLIIKRHSPSILYLYRPSYVNLKDFLQSFRHFSNTESLIKILIYTIDINIEKC